MSECPGCIARDAVIAELQQYRERCEAADAKPLMEGGVLDAIALVGALRAGDVAGAAEVIWTGSLFDLTVSLAKLMAEAADESDVSYERFASWAEHAAARRHHD